MTVSAVAVASPSKLHRVDSENVHVGDDDGAMNWFQDEVVTLELGGAGKVTAAASGTRRDHQLYSRHGADSYNTDDVTKFATSWTGTYKLSKDGQTATLELAVASDRCSRTFTRDGEAPQTRPCRAAVKHATVTCTTDTIEKIAAWRCDPANADDLGESPDWILGKGACIEVAGGHRSSLAYRACP
jgi:hypothetical protein